MSLKGLSEEEKKERLKLTSVFIICIYLSIKICLKKISCVIR
jgi:hypothetical protein